MTCFESLSFSFLSSPPSHGRHGYVKWATYLLSRRLTQLPHGLFQTECRLVPLHLSSSYRLFSSAHMCAQVNTGNLLRRPWTNEPDEKIGEIAASGVVGMISKSHPSARALRSSSSGPGSVSITQWLKSRANLAAWRSSTTLKASSSRRDHPVALRFGSPSISRVGDRSWR